MNRIKKPQEGYMANTAAANSLRRFENNPERYEDMFYGTCAVDSMGKVKVDYFVSRLLSMMDWVIADAVHSFYKNGIDEFTTSQLLKFMCGKDEHSTAEMIKSTRQSLKLLANTRLGIDITCDINMRKDQNPKVSAKVKELENLCPKEALNENQLSEDKIILDGMLLPLDYNENSNRFIIAKPPILFEYAAVSGQMLIYDQKLLQKIDKISCSVRHLTERYELIRKIEINKQMKKTEFKLVVDNLGSRNTKNSFISDLVNSYISTRNAEEDGGESFTPPIPTEFVRCIEGGIGSFNNLRTEIRNSPQLKKRYKKFVRDVMAEFGKILKFFTELEYIKGYEENDNSSIGYMITLNSGEQNKDEDKPDSI